MLSGCGLLSGNCVSAASCCAINHLPGEGSRVKAYAFYLLPFLLLEQIGGGHVALRKEAEKEHLFP